MPTEVIAEEQLKARVALLKLNFTLPELSILGKRAGKRQDMHGLGKRKDMHGLGKQETLLQGELMAVEKQR